MNHQQTEMQRIMHNRLQAEQAAINDAARYAPRWRDIPGFLPFASIVAIGTIIFAVAHSLARHQVSDFRVGIPIIVAAALVVLGGIITTPHKYTWISCAIAAAYAVGKYL
jgi:hypothetical protein